MNSDTILEKIELIEKPIEPLGKPLDWFNTKIELFERLRRLSRNSNKIVIYWFSILMFVFTIILGGFGSVEIIRGDHPVFKKVPDGAVCNDGWRSDSQGPGTCSWHKGVDYYVFKDVQVDFHYANPEPYLIYCSIVLLLIIGLFIFKYDFRGSILEVLLKITRGTYIGVYLCLAFPLILTRACLQTIIVLPMFLRMTVSTCVARKK